MTETLELALHGICEGDLEIDNCDLVIAYVEHMDDSIEVKGYSLIARINENLLARVVKDINNQRAKDAKAEVAVLGMEI